MAIRNLLKHIIGCVTSECGSASLSVCACGLVCFCAATFELETEKGVASGCCLGALAK